VTVVERDSLPEGPGFRKGVPQSRHLHAFLMRGRQIAERLFPSLEVGLLEAGAVLIDSAEDFEILSPAGFGPRFRSGIPFLQSSRELLEHAVRERVASIPNVRFLQKTDVTGLLANGGAVAGAKVRSRDGKRDEMQPLNREQTRRLLEAAEGDRLQALYVVAVTAGLRPGEMLALRWSDVDLQAGTLQINRALAEGEFAATKTARSRRKIELSNSARVALRTYRKRQLEERMQKAGLWKDHGLVFPSSVGTPLSHRNLVRSFKALLKRAGLPSSTRLYDLRHTCATLLLNSYVQPKYVQELLGHASIAQTLDTYSHVLKAMDSGIGDTMDDALG